MKPEAAGNRVVVVGGDDERHPAAAHRHSQHGRRQLVKGALRCIFEGAPHGFVSIVILKVLES